jgi:hypothetical protein
MICRPHLLLSILVALGVVAGLAVRADVAAANGCPLRLAQGTEGTEASPILVSDRAALAVLATDPLCYESAYVFRQTANIDLSASPWTPIGGSNAFNGVYDGGGHSITGMTVQHAAAGHGLFGALYGGTVRDLVISGARVTATEISSWSGALAGRAVDSQILRVRVLNSTIAGTNATGGLVGLACSSQISDSRSEAVVSGLVSVGGLIGSAASRCITSVGDVSVLIRELSATVTDSAATGAVSGDTQVGGLIGEVDGATVSRSFATGAVSASDGSAGGLVGSFFSGYGPLSSESQTSLLVDVYASGAVAGAGAAGGLIGGMATGAAVIRAYAVGRVTGSQTGGLVGTQLLGCASVGISACSTAISTAAAPTSFWNTTTTGQTASSGDVATGQTTAQLQTLGTYSTAGWTITRGWSAPTAATWGICPSANGGYPFLLAQYTAATQPCAGLPSAPRDLKIIVGDSRVTVTWQAPASDGGSPVTGFTATASMQKDSPKAAPSCTAAAGATSCTITGLRNGRAYRFSATAANLEGTGVSASVVATPRIGLAVISTRRSGLTIVTRVRVGSAGRLAQVGTATGMAGAVCRASAQPKRASILVLRCSLSARAEQALAARPLAVAAALRFRPTSGPVRTAVRSVRFGQTGAAGPVTG